MKRFLSEHWWPWIGRPKVFRCDGDGCFSGKEIETWLTQQGIFVDIIPRDAHWQNSLPERAIQVMKDMLSSMSRDTPETDPQELLGRALAAYNDMMKTPGGNSPFMRLIGRTPNVTSDLAEEPANLPLISAEAAGDDEFGKSPELRRIARQAFIEAEAKHQLRVAQATREELSRSSTRETLCLSGEESRKGNFGSNPLGPDRQS